MRSWARRRGTSRRSSGGRERTGSGDRAELEELPEDAPIWAQVTSSTETRIGPRCDHYERASSTRARRAAEEAQIVVVNHHLFFADLATRGPHGGGILPDYETVIFDEAHQIEDVVTQFFGVEVSTTRIEKLVRDAGRVLFVTGNAKQSPILLDHVLTTASGFFSALPRPGPHEGRSALPREAFAAHVEQAMLALDAALDAVEQHCRARAADAEPVAQMSRRAAQIRGDMATIAEGGPGSQVTWVQRRGRGVSIGSSPVDVSELLREELLHRTPRVVLTSATLSTGGSFDFIKRRLGLDFEVREEQLPSPFDYASQAALYVPPDMPDPRDAAWSDRAVSEVRDLIEVTAGGAFVLCTSFRVMNELARRLGSELPHPVMVQGQAPKASLLDRFRAAGDAVLFATASFWEGVDVPGDALRLVVIDKLPFEVPTDPLVVARCERMKADGEAPFMRYLVPSAALSLKQGFGRLVRTRRDRGIVAILDPRIVRKGYGRVFLRSLPEARRCETLDAVRAFWTEAS